MKKLQFLALTLACVLLFSSCAGIGDGALFDNIQTSGDKNAEKLLHYGVDKVFVCESQINTLTMRTWGYDSVGLFGTGSAHQYKVLKESGLRKFVLCFDGDEAGRKGASRFIKNMDDIFPLIQVVQVPNGKDINDLTKEQFDELYEEAKHSLI